MFTQKVLIVDDHPHNLIALEEVLEKPGREIVRAHSGNEALALMLKQRFSLVVLDVQMPEMDGFEVARWIRSRKQTADIPIIFVTAISKEEEYIFRGYQAGAIDYLFKPVEPTVLNAKVDFLLQLELRTWQLEESLERIRQLRDNNELLLKYVGEGILGLAPDGTITFANPAAAELFSMHRTAIEGKLLNEFLRLANENVHDWQHLDMLRKLKSGITVISERDAALEINRRRFPISFTAAPIMDKQRNLTGIAFSFHDITRHKQLEEKLIRMAEYDSLTGLANPHLFENILSSAIARADRSVHPLAVLCVDIDHFFRINDAHDFDVGDQLLKQMGERILGCTRKADTVARYRADQFMILLETLDSPSHAEFVAKKINNTLRRPFVIGDRTIESSVSIGVVIYPNSPGNEQQLLDYAAEAMFEAKKAGRDTYQLFNPRSRYTVA